jgi:pimeloyl-ACP methyl ester carboxylesterase
MASIEVNGITITYESSGDPGGPAVLLNMGLALQLISWPCALVEGLVQQGFHVIRYDNRDAGLSSHFDHLGAPNLWLAYLRHVFGWRQHAAYTLHDMAADAVGLLDALGVAAAHIVGVSMGGMVSQIMAARYPAHVLSLTSIMSSSGRPGLPGPTPAARRILLRRTPSAHHRARVVEQMVDTFRTIGSPGFPTPEALLRQMAGEAVARNVNGAGVARQLVAIAASGDRSALLHDIRCPALVIHGDADPLLPCACGIDTARQIPGARLELIEGMGHDMPPALVGRLLALLEPHLRGNMAG